MVHMVDRPDDAGADRLDTAVAEGPTAEIPHCADTKRAFCRGLVIFENSARRSTFAAGGFETLLRSSGGRHLRKARPTTGRVGR